MTAPTGATYVLGGGVAGLVAAFGLADRGHRVVLLESRRQVGGRAFATAERASGRRLDNGPHAMIGCYRAMRALVRRLGSEDRFVVAPSLAMAYRTRTGVASRLRLARLPVPIAMPVALFGLGMPFLSRCRAFLAMATVVFGAPAHWTVADWLRRRWQDGAPDAWLWRPLCRAIMNCEPDEASARDFLATLREAFFGGAARAAFWFPRRDWSDVLGDPAPAALAAAGIELRTGARVVEVPTHDGRVVALGLGDGSRVPIGASDLVVSALPWFVLRTLVPTAAPGLESLRSAPIVSAFVELEPGAPAIPDDGPVTALVDGDPFHFLMRTPGGDPRQFALLSGGSRAFDGMRTDAIERLAREHLARHYPGFPVDAPARVVVRKENLATFVAAPGSAALRPAPGPLRDGPKNLLVCGDWTATGLPATLEGAARSAEAMLRGLDAQRAAARA